MTNRLELADRLESGASGAFHPQMVADLREAARLLREPVAGEVEAALQPFADFAVNVDQHGWTSDIHRERISDWFGPSDFRAVKAILRARLDAEGKGA